MSKLTPKADEVTRMQRLATAKYQEAKDLKRIYDDRLSDLTKQMDMLGKARTEYILTKLILKKRLTLLGWTLVMAVSICVVAIFAILFTPFIIYYASA